MSSSIDSEYLSGCSDLDVPLYVEDQNQEVAVDPFQSSSQPDDDLQPSPAKKRKRGSATRATEVWRHSRTLLPHEKSQNDHKQAIFSCNYCSWQNNVSNARVHLKSKHGIITTGNTLQQRATTQALAIAFSNQERIAHTQADERARLLLRNACDKNTFRNAVARLVSSQSLAHSIVESKEFKAMCLALNHQAGHALIHSHTTIPRRIASNFEYQRSLVKAALHRASSAIQLCTDSWTSGLSNQREFQAVNAQWVDEKSQVQRALLALPELTHGHAGESVAIHVVATLKAYGIEHKLGYITCDNATANDTLCRAVEHALTSEGIRWNAATQRLRCLGHILNIATQAFIFAKDAEAVDVAVQHTASIDVSSIEDSIASLSQTQEQGWRRCPPLQKLHAFAVDLRTLRYHNEFRDLAGKVIKIPGATRWNGWFIMLQEALETKPTIAQIIDRHPELEKHRLSPDDWETLKATRDFLHPFWQVTVQTEGRHVTLDEMQTTMDFVIYHLEQSERRHKRNTGLLAAINTCWHAFNKWYERIDEVPAYVTAVLLHPSKRLKGLKKSWNTKQWVDAGVARARDLWELYKESHVPASIEVTDTTEEPSLWERYKQHIDAVPQDDDFMAFINAPPTRLAQGTSALVWWCSPEQREAYPALSKLAVDVLSPFAMSAASETIFSGARRTISWERARLGGSTVEHSECTKSWQKSGIAYSEGYDVDESDEESLSSELAP